MKPVLLANGEGGVGVQAAADVLQAGGTALDAVEAGIRVVEQDPAVRSVGFGGRPNLLGEMECDASIMCGATRRTGAVGALKEYLHAISVARQVMERTPHVMIVGEGAARFAAEIGEKKADMLAEQSKADYSRWFETRVPEELKKKWPDVPLAELSWPAKEAAKTAGGTTCFLALARDNNWAGGVSTSGWAYKHPGRLGDSPVISAGLYVDNRGGAAACTHTGEMTIRAGTARTVVAAMKRGASAADACAEAIDDLRALTGGYLGPVVVHAIDKEGTPCVVGLGFKETTPPWWFWTEGMTRPEQRKVTKA